MNEIGDRNDAVFARVRQAARAAWLEARAVAALARAGVLRIEHPQRLLAVARTLGELGPVGAAPRIAALRHGPLPAIADERGELTYHELEEQVNRLCNAFRARGLEPGAGVGILCRNHRFPLIVAFAASRAGLNSIWLNTAFSPKQAAEVAARESVDLLVFDADLAEIARDIAAPLGRIACAIDDPEADELMAVIDGGSAQVPPPPSRPGRMVQLTSGTTGLPKGAPRPEPRSMTIPGGLLERMPMRSRGVTIVAPPLFHGTGLVIAMLTISLGSKLVLRRRFDAAALLEDIAEHRATAVSVVPIMLQRLLALGDDEVRRRDLSSLRVVFSAGSRLPATVAAEATRLLGDVVYNLYGSTEVSVVTLATPKDLAEAPGSVGRPALGVQITIRDAAGREAAPGETGRIFVSTTAPFEGYTGGGGKEIIDGKLSTGDLGHLDSAGRLYIDGRDDEMIVSGGENVFPREIEDLLVTHPAIADAAALGVDDDEFGQRMRAFVVLEQGHQLDADQVRDFVKANLARYKAPRDVVFIEEMPRNPTGKVLKRELVARGDA